MFAEPFNSLSLPFVALASRPEELALMSSRSALARHGEGFHDVSHGGVAVERRHKADWDQSSWDWDPVRFVAQPASGDGADGNGDRSATASYEDSGGNNHNNDAGGACNLFEAGVREPRIEQEFLSRDSPEASGGLDLKLGGSSFFLAGEEAGNGARINKRYRSSSPGAQFPTCQVDDCKADLRLSKDYHRRHKVCEPHSKASKALVAHQLQRFCQQCSRFHPLAEFDEGKRSCRRRLAGHNKRRRKTQPDAAAAQAYLLAETSDFAASKGGGILSFLHMLTQLQASKAFEGLNGMVNNQEAFLQYYQKACMNGRSGDFNADHNIDGNGHGNGHVNGNGNGNAVAGRAASTPYASQNGHEVAEKQLVSSAFATAQEKLSQLLKAQASQASKDSREFHSQTVRGDKSGTFSLGPGANAVELQSNGRHVRSPPSSGGASKPDEVPHLHSRSTMSRQSAEVFADVSQGWSKSTPVAHRLFPLQSSSESRATMNDTSASPGRDVVGNGMLALLNGQSRMSQAEDAHSLQPTLHLQQPATQKTSENSTSGSDLSPEGSNADSQDLVGRILIKLFDRNPGDFPHSLRSQILDWLSRTPSDMESYIKPGCVMLTIFLSLPDNTWEHICRRLRWSWHPLLEASPDFWSTGRIEVQVEEQTIFISDGKVQMHRLMTPLFPPHILSVRPIAVVSDHKTRLVLRGYNLGRAHARVNCLYQGKSLFGRPSLLESEDAVESDQGGPLGHHLQPGQRFGFDCGPFSSHGRCFIEVEQSASKGNTLPVLVAESAVCAEIRTLEDEVEVAAQKAAQKAEDSGLLPDEVSEYANTARAATEAEVRKFLFELGWLLQRSMASPELGHLDGSSRISSRLERLLVYSVERDWCALVKKLLDLYFASAEVAVDRLSLGAVGALHGGVTLLHRAVRRNCRSMVELLLAYVPNLPLDVAGNPNAGMSDMKAVHPPIFTPDMPGPRGITPLHIAAGMQEAEAIIDLLTNDSGQLGIHAWSNARDASGQTPLNCAIASGKLSYVAMVRGTVARRQSQTLWKPHPAGKSRVLEQQTHLAIGGNERKFAPIHGMNTSGSNQKKDMTLVAMSRNKRAFMGGVRGQMHRPFLLCMVAVACVCVVVCVFLRGAPHVSCVVPPFTWSALDYGPK